jgi:hypothetical protein
MIVVRTLNLDISGIGAIKTLVANIANNLLTAHSKGPVGKY